jgi:PKD repeat protein
LAGQPGGPSPKKLIFGCLGFIGFSLLLFIIFVIAYVSQTSASGENSLATTLGVNPAEFTNTLILLTNLIFGAIIMVSFFVAVFGLFRGAMAPKTDKPARASGFRQAGVAGAIFLVLTAIWVVIFLYLSGKQVNIPQQQSTAQGIVTEPAEPLRLTAPVEVKFDATQIPYNPNRIEITFYQWDFGDGTSSTSPVVSHTYRDIGQYNVQLTVTARDKTTEETLTQSFTTLVTVTEVQISADFSITPQSGPAPLSVALDATASESPAGEITSYEWDFKGQNNFRDATGATARTTFDREGEYEIKLRVTDNTGKSAITSQKIQVGGPDVPLAVIDIPTTDGKYYVGKQLSFLAEQSSSPNGTISKYEWDFGDGSPKSTTRTSNHTYKTAGLYEVVLIVTDETGKTGKSSQKLTLVKEEEAPQAIISTTPAFSEEDRILGGTAPFEVVFDASKSTDPDDNIVEFKWDFDGDGQSDAAGTTASYVYKTAGSYNATLTAIDAADNESTNILVVRVAAQDLTARLTADTLEGNAPLAVTFDASASSYPDGQITSYEWDFGDGSPKLISAAKVSYKYDAIGTFTATVTAKASDGKTSTAELVINVRPIALQACFIPSLEQGNAPLEVEFDPRCSQGAVAKYLWDFGDGTTSRTRKPIHSFDKPGSYQVTLEVTDNQNVISKFSKSILVIGEVQ